jgi:uncharacterized alkaline shock family protein YloU
MAAHVIEAMARAALSVVPDEPPEVAGGITIPNEVIGQLVGLTVLECYGVVGMAATNLTQGVARLLSRERITQGVAVRREGAVLTVDLYIVVGYGLNLAEVAATVRSRVKYNVEKLTGLQVGAVNIHVQGVRHSS